MTDYTKKFGSDFKIPTFNFDSLITQTVNQINDNSHKYKSNFYNYVIGLFFAVLLLMLAAMVLFILIFISIRKVKPIFTSIAFLAFLFLSGVSVFLYSFKNAEEFYIFDFC